MPGEQRKATALIESDPEDGKNNIMECDATASDGKTCPIWTPVCLQTKFYKKFVSEPLLCGFISAAKTSSGAPKRNVSQETFLQGTLLVDAKE